MGKRIAFVIPWYSKNISGGAEMECRVVTKHLKKAGVDVEILTTCIKDFSSDWNVNYYSEGLEMIDDIPVRRFKADKRDTVAFDRINYKLINHIPITLEEEDIFFNEMAKSKKLNEYIKKYEKEYKAFVFIPYMFGTTYFGSKACLSNAAAIPCVHNESYAYMQRTKEMFKNFKKIIFNAEPEKELAYKLYDLSDAQTATIGLGLDTNFSYSEERFRNKYGITKPFLLYAGRKDVGKRVDLLIQYFEQFCKENPEIDLVLIGGGNIEIPKSISHRVYDLGFVDIQDKYDAYGASLCLCQPSTNESFSIVIMESWVAGRPVLVNEKCDVTTDFAKRSQGGLYFDNYSEFKECVLLYYENEDLAKKMGSLGGKFVKTHFSWETVVEKYKQILLK